MDSDGMTTRSIATGSANHGREVLSKGVVGVAVALMVLAVACSSPTLEPSSRGLAAGTKAEVRRLTPAEVYEKVAPSVAYVETSLSTGSGLLLPSGVVLTNAHVAWPYRSARVVFPNGAEIPKAAVVGIDQMADLAVLDVSSAAGLPEPARFDNGEDLATGSTVYLIGYPAEGDSFPTPAITQGIISTKRSWEPLDLTYFQTDALGEGGQSGGALVSERGEIIGLSTLLLGERFTLATSVHDIMSRVDALAAGVDVAGLGNRDIASHVGKTELEAEIPHFFAEQVWIMWPTIGETVEIEVESDHDAWVTMYAPDGYAEIDADDSESGIESGSFEVMVDGPHFVTVGSRWVAPITVMVRSNSTLVPHTDPDDGVRLEVGEPTVGSVDHPGDADWFEIDLEEGQRVFITAETLNFDAQVALDQATNSGDVLFYDDDSAGGIFGLTPGGNFTAKASGTYLVWVREAFYEGPDAYDHGGYILSVQD